MILKRHCQVEHRDDLSTNRVEVHTCVPGPPLPRARLLPRMQLVARRVVLVEDIPRDAPALRQLDLVGRRPGPDSLQISLASAIPSRPASTATNLARL